MLADYHVHTAYSDDSEYPMEAVIQDAIEKGLSEICFTDHVDYGIKRDWDDPRGILTRPGGPGEPENMPLCNVDYPRYFAQIHELQQKYSGRIRLKAGLEFGMQTHTAAQYQALFDRWPMDFVLLSVHQIEDKEFWTQEFQAGHTQQEYNLRYYEELLALVQQYHDYSVLAHMDLITRYDKNGIYPFEALRPILTKILQTVIADGKGIEANTSCYRYGLPDLTPSRAILQLYHQLGGRILTFGSDSHKPEHLGAFLAQTQQELRALGFTEWCTFDTMQPVFHSL